MGAASDTSTDKDGITAELIAVAGAATTLIAAISALAVTGALQQMQRNHGLILIAALGLVLAAAILWVAVAVWEKSIPDATVARPTARLLRIGALAAFGAGVLTGLIGMVFTQQAEHRPTVVATYDAAKKLLTVTATAYNLGSEGQMLTQIRPLDLYRLPNGSLALGQTRGVPLRWGYSGPDDTGRAVQKFVWANGGNYEAVEVSATTGRDITPCMGESQAVGTNVPRHAMSGCVILLLTNPQYPRATQPQTAG